MEQKQNITKGSIRQGGIRCGQFSPSSVPIGKSYGTGRWRDRRAAQSIWRASDALRNALAGLSKRFAVLPSISRGRRARKKF